jgi:hypothetical protein
MKMSSVVPGRIRHLLIALAVSALAGCSLVPGNQSYSDRDESAVMLPVQQGDALVPEHIKIKPITAELIVDMFKAARPPIGDGTSVARKATEKRAAFRQQGFRTDARVQAWAGRHHFDHRLGSPRTDHSGRQLPYRRAGGHRWSPMMERSTFRTRE